jgi:hypothetical protein
MIPKSGNRFSEKIMPNKKLERDDDSTKSHPALVTLFGQSAASEELLEPVDMILPIDDVFFPRQSAK